MKKKFGATLVFLSSLMWAFDAVFRQPVLKGGLSVSFVAFLEHILNSIVSLPLVIKQRTQFKILSKGQWFGLLYIGFFASALAALLFVEGAVKMNYNFTIAVLLQKLQPIFAIILAVIFLKEKLAPKFWLFAIPALFGAYLVSFGLISPFSLFTSTASVGVLGPVLAILASVFWAGGTVVGKYLLKNLDFKFVNGMRFLLGMVFLFFYVIFFSKFQFSEMNFFFWKNTLIVAMMTGFFALLIYYIGLKSTKASTASLMELGYPLSSALIYWKILGITLNSWQIFGGLILLVSALFLALKENSFKNEQSIQNSPSTVE